MRLILATHNRHKIKEIADVIKHPKIEIFSLLDYDVKLPPETGTTFVENARIKAQTVYRKLKSQPAFILADDSGLIVDALGGRPGVYSSRYSGEPVDYERNNRKLLSELSGVAREKRTAHFVCLMVLIDPSGKEYEIEGKVDGLIAEKESAGEGGFGYDPVFYIPERGRTVAEISLAEKNRISHRGRAAKKTLEILVEFLDKTCA